jgi:L-ascorbate metabolism protein UlaG (beta-lactamase superfamily)
MKLTFYGQNCFLIELNGYKLLMDPSISYLPNTQHIDISSIEANFILLTHGHGDHVMDAESIARRCDATIISNFEIVSWYQEKGLKGHPMNHGGKWKFPFGTVKYVNAVHSSVLPDGTYGGNPGGFVIYDGKESAYFAGDTALTFDMKLIPMTCPALDFAILPIGDNFTMGIEDANIAADFLQCKEIVGCHFDTFPYIEINKNNAIQYTEKKGNRLHILEIGQSISFNNG